MTTYVLINMSSYESLVLEADHSLDAINRVRRVPSKIAGGGNYVCSRLVGGLVDPRLAGGHHETCAVFWPAPDGGPSLRPCDCRVTMGDPTCTPLSATWCPVCGDCACDPEADGLDDPDCPLHSRDSAHAT